MTKLLVSIRDVEEAHLAIAAGVPLVDMKEPNDGPLAASSVDVWDEVADILPGDILLSAALGELIELGPSVTQQLPGRVSYAKVGLSGLASDPAWVERWSDWKGKLPQHVSPVAVAYADWDMARSPSCDTILSHLAPRASALLIDTFCKDGRSVFDHHDALALGNWLGHAKSLGLVTVLAGSICFSEIEMAVSLKPDYLAVRGGVCNESRKGKVEIELMRKWKKAINNHFGLSIQ